MKNVEIVGLSWGRRRDAHDVAAACGIDLLKTKTVTKIPHSDYRVLVTASALNEAKKRGARKPVTRDYVVGKNVVDKMLVDRGLGVTILNARPGRVTR